MFYFQAAQGNCGWAARVGEWQGFVPSTHLAVYFVEAVLILLGVAAVQVTNFSSDVADINSRDVIELMLITQVRSGKWLVGSVVPLSRFALSLCPSFFPNG